MGEQWSHLRKMWTWPNFVALWMSPTISSRSACRPPAGRLLVSSARYSRGRERAWLSADMLEDMWVGWLKHGRCQQCIFRPCCGGARGWSADTSLCETCWPEGKNQHRQAKNKKMSIVLIVNCCCACANKGCNFQENVTKNTATYSSYMQNSTFNNNEVNRHGSKGIFHWRVHNKTLIWDRNKSGLLRRLSRLAVNLECVQTWVGVFPVLWWTFC